ncbi:MAG: hypothetical protein DME25_17060, partial [Verrucomicrobia bacterium]
MKLSRPTNATVTVDFYTTDLTAEAGMDYLATNGTLVFGPNQTSQTLAVTVLGDLLDESDETFQLTLTNATVLSIAVNHALGTIIDDEPLTMSISDASGLEGGGSAHPVVFVVSLLKAVDYEVTVDFATANGTTVGSAAISGVDFV